MTDQPTPEVLPIVIEQEEYPIWVLHAARACTDRKFGLKMREDHPSVAEFNDLLFAGAIAAHEPKPEASVPISKLREIWNRHRSNRDFFKALGYLIYPDDYSERDYPKLGEPVAYLFHIKRKNRTSIESVEFAAIDYLVQENEELLSKQPLYLIREIK